MGRGVTPNHDAPEPRDRPQRDVKLEELLEGERKADDPLDVGLAVPRGRVFVGRKHSRTYPSNVEESWISAGFADQPRFAVDRG